MPKILKVRCNGPERHINEVDLALLLVPGTIISRSLSDRVNPLSGITIHEKYIKPCNQCIIGEVIITREMIEEVLNK